MLNINTKLKELEEQGKRINVGIVGAGQMGRGMVSQMFCMKGICPIIVSDLNTEIAKKAFIMAGIRNDDIAVANTVSEAETAIKNGRYVVTENLEVVNKALSIDVVIDATVFLSRR